MIRIRFIDSRLALARSSWVLLLRVISINIYPCYVTTSILTMARSLAALCTHLCRPINSHLRVGFHSQLLCHVSAVSKVRPAWVRSHIFTHFSIISQCGSKISFFGRGGVCARVFFPGFSWDAVLDGAFCGGSVAPNSTGCHSELCRWANWGVVTPK